MNVLKLWMEEPKNEIYYEMLLRMSTTYRTTITQE